MRSPYVVPARQRTLTPGRAPNEQYNRRDVPIGGYPSPPVELNSSRRTARASGFFDLIECGEPPER